MMSREESKRQRFERELLTCKHFNGVYAPGMKPHPCKAGVDYRAHVGGDDFGWVARLPCTPRWADENPAVVVSCALREFPTRAEVEAEEREVEASIAITTAAIKLCREHAGGKRGIAGEVTCPKCRGRLHYTVAASNGHLWGRCETAGCLVWMM